MYVSCYFRHGVWRFCMNHCPFLHAKLCTLERVYIISERFIFIYRRWLKYLLGSLSISAFCLDTPLLWLFPFLRRAFLFLFFVYAHIHTHAFGRRTPTRIRIGTYAHGSTRIWKHTHMDACAHARFLLWFSSFVYLVCFSPFPSFYSPL